MTARFSDHVIGPALHAARPLTTDAPLGTMFSCSDHSKVYRNDVSGWIEWITVAGLTVEQVHDLIDTHVVAGTNVTLTANDAADTLTVNALPTTWVSLNAQTGTTFVAAQSDETTLVTLTNAGAITVTLPASLTARTRIDFAVLGAGMATFVGSGGATIIATPSAVTRATGSAVSAIKLDSTRWLVTGDLA